MKTRAACLGSSCSPLPLAHLPFLSPFMELMGQPRVLAFCTRAAWVGAGGGWASAGQSPGCERTGWGRLEHRGHPVQGTDSLGRRSATVLSTGPGGVLLPSGRGRASARFSFGLIPPRAAEPFWHWDEQFELTGHTHSINSSVFLCLCAPGCGVCVSISPSRAFLAPLAGPTTWLPYVGGFCRLPRGRA